MRKTHSSHTTILYFLIVNYEMTFQLPAVLCLHLRKIKLSFKADDDNDNKCNNMQTMLSIEEY